MNVLKKQHRRSFPLRPLLVDSGTVPHRCHALKLLKAALIYAAEALEIAMSTEEGDVRVYERVTHCIIRIILNILKTTTVTRASLKIVAVYRTLR